MPFILRPVPLWILALLVFPLLNAALNRAVVHTNLPLFLDSIFTAVSAAVFGLWPGLATALLTNAMIELLTGFPGVHLPFALCGLATAFVVAFSVSRSRFSTTLDLALVLLAVSLANAFIGALVAVFVYGGYTSVNIDVIVSGFETALGDIFSAAFLARLPANLVDKSFAVLAAFLAAEAAGRSAPEATVSG